MNSHSPHHERNSAHRNGTWSSGSSPLSHKSASPPQTPATSSPVKKGMQLNVSSVKAPIQTQPPPSYHPPPPAPAAPAPSNADIFAELGLAAHPRIPHHHPAPPSSAPPSSSAAAQRTLLSTTTTARGSRPPPQRIVSDGWGDEDGFEDVNDDWGDGDDLDDLLLDD